MWARCCCKWFILRWLKCSKIRAVKLLLTPCIIWRSTLKVSNKNKRNFMPGSYSWIGSWSNFFFEQLLRMIPRALHSTWSRWWLSSCKPTTTAVQNNPSILCRECPTLPRCLNAVPRRTIWPNNGRRSSILMVRWALSLHHDHRVLRLLCRAADRLNDNRWNFKY